MNLPNMPFTILALAPLAPVPDSPFKPKVFSIGKSELDEALNKTGPSISISLPKELCPAGYLDIEIKRMKDFHPDGIVETNSFLLNLRNARDFVRDAVKQGAPDEEVHKGLANFSGLPFELTYSAKQQNVAGPSAVDDILQLVSMPEQAAGQSPQPGSWLGKLDKALADILGIIFADEQFKMFESAWRGAELLMKQGPIDGDVKLKIAPISREALEDSLDPLLMELVENPPSVIILDLPFDSSARSIELLLKIANLGATIFVPIITWLDERFFNLSQWEELDKLPYLPNHLERPEFAKWRRFQQKEPSSAWLAVTCNRFLTRYPYGLQNKPRSVNFEEKGPLWISPVWGLACMLAKSAAQTGWPTRFVEWQNTKVENLALRGPDGGRQLAAETAFPEDRLPQFAKAGIIPLVAPMERDFLLTTVDTAADAKSSLSHQLMLSRIVNLALWCRENLETGSAIEIERGLKSAIGEFFRKTGHEPPDDLSVTVAETEPGKPPSVMISMTPAKNIISSGKSIELNFEWK